jgi:hypothetical protein
MVLEKEWLSEIKTNFTFKLKMMQMKTYNLKLGILLICITIGLTSFGQQLVTEIRELDLNAMTYNPGNQSAGKNIKLSYAEIEGTPFWSEQWNPAIVFFGTGGKAKISQAKLNLYTNEIHYLCIDGTELAAENEGITRLVFLNKNNLTQPIASFAKLTNHITGNGYVYYRVLNAGKYQLILLQKQLVKTSPYDPILAKTTTSFYTKKDYAIYAEGKVIPLKDLDRNSILSVAPANELANSWLQTSKSKLKSEKDVIEYLEQLNK